MPIHLLKLIDRKEIAHHTLLFVFEKPEGFTFKPGQYGGFTLINPAHKDPSGVTRRFSLACIPTDDHIAIAIRMQASVYKSALKELPIGGEIKFAGPTGNFILHEDITVPAVLIAGGIGITPFYSMIKQTSALKSPQPITLFYGNAKSNEAAFLSELKQIEQANPNFKLIATVDKPEHNWQYETGYITHTMIKKYISDIHAPIYYVCGSPAMVTALQELLAEMGIDEERIKIEDFPGY